ncbi:hypothetical protein EIP91_011641 [Steccherinum ochraceum]|uniref:Uncharacterized protein n=1 Tax=Steccherinum ochraceum TaxID=92696 RepID=A0A4R0RHN5_9APHY|nr:hypothetical protein EIP91_011641 [Steccherinum ochraceum]
MNMADGVRDVLCPGEPVSEFARAWEADGERVGPADLPKEYDGHTEVSQDSGPPLNPGSDTPGPVLAVPNDWDRCRGQIQCSEGCLCDAHLGAPSIMPEEGQELPLAQNKKAHLRNDLEKNVRKTRSMTKSTKTTERPPLTLPVRRVVSAPAALDWTASVNGFELPSNDVNGPLVIREARSPSVSISTALEHGRFPGKTTTAKSKAKREVKRSLLARSHSERITLRKRKGQKKSEPSGSCWTTAEPSPPPPSSFDPCLQAPPPNLPAIWASSKSDLEAVLPEMAQAVNGLAWHPSLDSLTWLLEGQMCSQDTWKDRSLEVSIVREHLEQDRARQPVYPPLNVTNSEDENTDMILFDDLPVDDAIGFLPRPSNLDPPATPPLSYAEMGPYHPSPISRHDSDNHFHSFSPSTSSNSSLISTPQSLAKQFDVWDPAAEHLRFTNSITTPFVAFGDHLAYSHLSSTFDIGQDPSYPRWPPSPGMPSYPETLPNYRSTGLSGAFSSNAYNNPSAASFGLPLSAFRSLRRKPTAFADLAFANYGSDADAEDMPMKDSNLSGEFVNTDIEYYPASRFMTEEPTKSTSRPLPIEVQTLLDSHSRGTLVSVVMSRDCSLLPFSLPPIYGVVFLGFFSIKNVTTSVGHAPGRENVERVCWKFELEWVPGGDSLDFSKLPSPTPWWLPRTGDDHAVPTHPYTLLPGYFTAARAPDGSPIPVTSPVALTRKGWHCTGCGKLNVQRFLCVQRCDQCKMDNGMGPIRSFHVRNMYNLAPLMSPWARYPVASVHCTKKEDLESGYKIYSYLIGSHGIGPSVVTHLFTGNLPAVQEGPERLWLSLQKHDLLAWRDVRCDLAAGPYYTYHGKPSPPLPENGVLNLEQAWTQEPECVNEARDLIHRLVREVWSDSFSVTELVVLGWLGKGHRKSPTLIPAKSRQVAILALGADVELSLAPQNGFQAQEFVAAESYQDPLSSFNLEIPPSFPDDDYEPYDPMDEEEEPIGAGLLSAAHGPLSTSLSEPSSEPTPPSNQSSLKDSKDGSLFLSLIHGDMVLLEGDDYNWSMKRTGMSIILIALGEALNPL